MQREKGFILRLDEYPVINEHHVWDRSPHQIQLLNYPSFDEAFIKLFSIPLAHYDESISFTRDKKQFIKDASISQHPERLPLVKLARSTTNVDGRRKSEIDLEINEASKLMTPGLVEMFKVARIDITQNILKIGEYDVTGLSIRENYGAEKDVLLAIRQQGRVDTMINPYRVELVSNVYNMKVPEPGKNGLKLIESFVTADYREAFLTLLQTKLETLDPIVAFNTALDKTTSSAILRDNVNNSSMVELLNVSRGLQYSEFPIAGTYLKFDNRLTQYMTELAIPELSLLKIQQGKSILVAGFNEQRTAATPTPEYEALIASLSATIQPVELNRIHNNKTIPPGDNLSKRI